MKKSLSDVLADAFVKATTTGGSKLNGAILIVRELRKSGYTIASMTDLVDIESDLREQASGSQDGYLLSVAERLRRIAVLDSPTLRQLPPAPDSDDRTNAGTDETGA